MKPLPKVFGYLAILASLAATYFAQTGHVPPAWLGNLLVLIGTLSHSATGTAPISPFGITATNK